MRKSVRTVGFGAVVGLMSAGSWLACSSSAPAPAGILDAGGGGAKEAAAETGSGGSDASTSSGASSSGSSASSGGASSSGSSASSSGSSTSSSSSSASTGGDDGGLDAGPGSDGGATDDGASDGGASDGGAITCESYCTLIQQACTGGNAQYPAGAAGTKACMNACQTFDTADAATGNTLLCHYDHAQNAITIGTHPHCWHAGPFGWGVCGTQCQDFCQISTSYCTAQGGYAGDAQPYPDAAACTTACPAFASVATATNGIVDGGFNASGPTSGNTRDCREYHLGAALQSTANQQLHCPHVAATSATCF